MAHELLLPQWSMGMHEGKILKWLKQVGDSVEEGEIIAEVESSKVVSELMADRDGVLLKLLVAEEDEVPVRTALCLIGKAGETVERVSDSEQAAEYGASSADSPPAPVGLENISATANARSSKIQVTPPARKLAKQQGIHLSQVTGSGPQGRIVIEDIEAILVSGTIPADVAAGVSLTGLRATIATNMVQSLQQSAQLTLTSSVDVSALVKLRKSMAASYGDMVAFALSRVLPNHPRLNALIHSGGTSADRIEMIEEINLGFAVALDDGLVVPVIHQANLLSLPEMAAQSAELAKRAKNGDLSAEQVVGGSFTISNLGAYGIDAFTPIINPPQVAILGIGRVQERPQKRGGELVWRHTCVLSLTFDHRVTDGAPAAKFLRALAGFISDEAGFREGLENH
ncbi:MAG: 2-oxo acid dehydrogenase subunit E2 [Gammaproteobacteria bacterium]|nr:MAG: 2-oxo acid dehydrogenase subunit E2 [Gammaproteobacteria bacterium]RLA11573.1 MAG: 2-oxo acid dehydrogenase subunit E2 [Gammaproteobacteria bacterium]